MKTILKSEALCKTYMPGKENEYIALKDISIDIKEGEFVTVMGASGSGKSTLLYNLSGMDTTTSGKVYFDGEDITSLSEKQLSVLRRKKMGFIFQQANLLKNLDIFDNIILSAYLDKKKDRKFINEKAYKLIEQTGIGRLAHHDITQVSGGQLQRAAVCRALINDPVMLFGDEPTGALNSSSTAELMDILSEINRMGTTILLVTHDVKVTARSERVLFMRDGIITGEKVMGRYDGTTEDLKRRETELSSWLSGLGF